jgi:hypothetical protein
MKIWLAGVVAVAGLAASVSARPIGPDVVVSTIGSTFTKYGTFNAGTVADPKLVTGYAVTTVSCNIGDAIAIWIDSTATTDPNRNKHPVIGTQMYRLYGGRFEQIGMSWLKHGFCAADAPNCTNLARPGTVNPTYQPNSSCDWLGLYATDTYSASLNGSQTNCGPRSEVNASTGVFPYPYVLGWNASGNCVFKRLQIANTDLSPALNTGARYFCEVQYVTTDESTTTGASGEFLASNADIRGNNASYREVLVGSLSTTAATGCSSTDGGYNLAFSGNTVALKPAIEAWKVVDPTVTLVTVDIPNDGRVIIGYKVTDLGNGTWNYEYAIYNHNSHRSVGSFSLPKKGAEVVPTNIGFHDVPYHSGEPYDGTDWTPDVSDGRISWATTPYATNANANAIRWSTTYNFRFQANRAPSMGSITLGLFRPDANDPSGLINVPGIAVPIDHCTADFDGSGTVGIQDLFDFLNAYFTGSPSADINGVGGISVEDIFGFLAAWFRGC